MGEDGAAREKCPFHELGWAGVGPGWIALLAAVVIGAVVAGVFLRGARTKGKRRAVVGGGGIREVSGDGGLDAIVVGAGVAGSALAYTLGKVCNCNVQNTM